MKPYPIIENPFAKPIRKLLVYSTSAICTLCLLYLFWPALSSDVLTLFPFAKESRKPAHWVLFLMFHILLFQVSVLLCYRLLLYPWAAGRPLTDEDSAQLVKLMTSRQGRPHTERKERNRLRQLTYQEAEALCRQHEMFIPVSQRVRRDWLPSKDRSTPVENRAR